MTDNDRITIFDTTLRDGEQSPGAAMTLEQKVRVAGVLERLKVDVIEAGFPVASDADFAAVRAVVQATRHAHICALARAKPLDIERAAEALAPAGKRGRIHTFIATSPEHMEFKLQMAPDEVLTAIRESVMYARSFCDDVEWSAEDATHSDWDFLCTCYETAIRAGATTLNVPDTTGYMLPWKFQELITYLRKHVAGIEDVVLSVHCHNDLGLAAANSLAAVLAGARQVECTINGIGERAGNAAMEEVVMATRVRSDCMPVTSRIDTRHFAAASELVSAVTGFVVAPNKAVVGSNAFAHASGIHQDGVLKRRTTYEIMEPADVGVLETHLVLTRHSGRRAVRQILEKHDLELDDELFADVFRRFEDLAASKKEVSYEELVALVDDRHAARQGPYEVLACDATLHARNGKRNAEALLVLRVNGEEQQPCVVTSYEGEVDACIQTVSAHLNNPATLKNFQLQVVGEGTGALARVSMTLSEDSFIARGSASDTSTMVAALKAYINALNALVRVKENQERIAATGP